MLARPRSTTTCGALSHPRGAALDAGDLEDLALAGCRSSSCPSRSSGGRAPGRRSTPERSPGRWPERSPGASSPIVAAGGGGCPSGQVTASSPLAIARPSAARRAPGPARGRRARARTRRSAPLATSRSCRRTARARRPSWWRSLGAAASSLGPQLGPMGRRGGRCPSSRPWRSPGQVLVASVKRRAALVSAAGPWRARSARGSALWNRDAQRPCVATSAGADGGGRRSRRRPQQRAGAARAGRDLQVEAQPELPSRPNCDLGQRLTRIRTPVSGRLSVGDEHQVRQLLGHHRKGALQACLKVDKPRVGRKTVALEFRKATANAEREACPIKTVAGPTADCLGPRPDDDRRRSSEHGQVVWDRPRATDRALLQALVS